MFDVRNFVKPIRHYVDVNAITSSVQGFSLDQLLSYLGQYGITVWRVARSIFAVLDFESKSRHLRRISAVSIPVNEDSLLRFALEMSYGVKLYTLRDLRNVLRGMIAHRMYGAVLGFLLPCEAEVKIMDESRGVVGVADLVCGDYVLELKSSTKTRIGHAYQLLIYMDLLNKKKGFLVYEDKVIELVLDAHKRLLSNAYNRLNKIYNTVHTIFKNIHLYENKMLRRFNMRVGELLKMLEDLGFIAKV